MNYWKQFSEMLGLESGEEFVLKDDGGKRIDKCTYRITENGVLYKEPPVIGWSSYSLDIIGSLLYGDVKAVPKPWKPKINEQYWYCSTICEPVAIAMTWGGFSNDLCRWKCGDCFKTKKEAEIKGKQIMEQIAKELEEE